MIADVKTIQTILASTYIINPAAAKPPIAKRL